MMGGRQPLRQSQHALLQRQQQQQQRQRMLMQQRQQQQQQQPPFSPSQFNGNMGGGTGANSAGYPGQVSCTDASQAQSRLTYMYCNQIYAISRASDCTALRIIKFLWVVWSSIMMRENFP